MAQSSDEAAVLAANAAFYSAFQSLSIEAMDAVWDHEEPVLCVHPGWPLLSGREPVMESWQRIFENATLMHFDITGAEVVVEGDALGSPAPRTSPRCSTAESSRARSRPPTSSGADSASGASPTTTAPRSASRPPALGGVGGLPSPPLREI